MQNNLALEYAFYISSVLVSSFFNLTNIPIISYAKIKGIIGNDQTQ